MAPMSQFEDCEELKGDLAFLSFDEGDEEFGDFIASFVSVPNPLGIFLRIKELKNEGNRLFKSNDFGTALEKYDLALKFLTFASVRHEEDKVNLFDYALSLISNSAICSLKLKDFIGAGQFSSVVLKYDPHNVKALYRRAMAAIELGRPDLAYSDLDKASELESSNQEVSSLLKKSLNPIFRHLEGSLDYSFQGSSDLGHNPDGYAKNLFASKQLTKPPLVEKGCVSNHNLDHSLDNEECAKETVKRRKIDELANHNSVKELSAQVEKDHDNHNDVQIGCEPSLTMKSFGFNEIISPTLDNTGDSPKASNGVTSSFHSVNNYLAEPKYRFSNRRRRGSSLMLSPSTYDALSQGKAVSFYNARDGSWMKIRVATSSHTSLKMQDSRSSTSAMSPSPHDSAYDAKEQEASMGDTTNSIEVQHQPMVVDFNNMAFNKSITEEKPFIFSSKPKRRPRIGGIVVVSHNLMKYRQRTRFLGKSSIVPGFSNNVCGCRKRKGVCVPDIVDKPRCKKSAPEESLSYANVESRFVGLVNVVPLNVVSDAESCC